MGAWATFASTETAAWCFAGWRWQRGDPEERRELGFVPQSVRIVPDSNQQLAGYFAPESREITM